MADIIHVSRHGRATHRVGLAVKPSVFALEFMGAKDSLRFRNQLVGMGFVNVTPKVALPKSGELVIPTQLFQKGIGRAAWSGYWHGLRKDPRVQAATWVCLSGHHGRSLDTTPFETPAEMNAIKETGFFNKPFHDHEWIDKAPEEDEGIFVYSSSARGSDHEAPPRYGAPFEVNRRCAGVFLSGCNTLTYPATRRWVRKTFPHAIVFGFVGSTMFGSHNVAPLLGTDNPGGRRGLFQREPGFWRSPSTWVVQEAKAAKRTIDEQLEHMVLKLNSIYAAVSGKGRTLAVIFDEHLYLVTSGREVGKLPYDVEW